MKEQQPRSRVVTFRLSENEYTCLKSACGEGRDSVSAVARRSVLEWSDAALSTPALEQRLAEIDGKLDALLGLLNGGRK